MSIGRPIEFDPDQALAAAMQLFWEQGYDSTSMQDLLRATGLSKSSLYSAFGSKKALFERSVELYLDDLTARMMEHLGTCANGRQFVDDTFLALAGEAGSDSARRGCLLWNTALEFGQKDAAIGKRVKQGIERFSSVFAAAIARAQNEGDVGKDVDAEAMGRYLLSSMCGVRAMLKGGVDKRRVREVVDIVLGALG